MENIMISDLITEAPQEVYLIDNIPVIVSREDLAYKAPLPPNAKMSALYEIVKHKAAMGFTKMVLFAKKQKGISYAIGFPYICEEFGIEPIITYPAIAKHPMPEWMKVLYTRGDTNFLAERLHPNMVSININQSKKIAEDLGAYFVPFGFDHALSVDIHSKRFVVPNACKTVVMATMTGMTLAGAIKSASNKVISVPFDLYQFPKFIGISCGRPPENVHKSMAQYITLPPINRLSVINPYDRNIKIDIDQPFPLHPDYELKAWKWLTDNIHQLAEPILFINVGA